MKISELFTVKRVLSFEIFPPKRTGSVNTIYSTVEKLKDLNPDFISVTYGAGGSESNTETLKIASAVKNNYGIESVAHLPCINLDKREVLKMLDDLRSVGIENILALRGDVNPNFTPKNDFTYAGDLISFIKENGDFNIIAAGVFYSTLYPYPEITFFSFEIYSRANKLRCDFSLAIQPISIRSSVISGTAIILSPLRSLLKTPEQIVYPFSPISRLKRVARSLTWIVFFLGTVLRISSEK